MSNTHFFSTSPDDIQENFEEHQDDVDKVVQSARYWTNFLRNNADKEVSQKNLKKIRTSMARACLLRDNLRDDLRLVTETHENLAHHHLLLSKRKNKSPPSASSKEEEEEIKNKKPKHSSSSSAQEVVVTPPTTTTETQEDQEETQVINSCGPYYDEAQPRLPW